MAEEDTDRDSARLRKVHDRAMRRMDSVAPVQAEQRGIALEDRRFVTIEGAMWEGSYGEAFENSPKPEIDQITQSLEKIETDYRENRLTVSFLPAGDSGDDDTANLLNGVYRADAANFKAQQAHDNGFQEGIRGGFGAWRVTTERSDPYDADNEDQRINPAMVITDADQSVYFDGNSRLYDKSDAKWAFIVTADSRGEAEDKWGADNIDDFPVADWSWQYEWYTPDVVRTAEYYEVVDASDELLTFTQKAAGIQLTEQTQRYFASEIDDDEIRDLRKEGWQVERKPMKRKRVRKYVLNGTRVLKDAGYIAGPNIPIVPFYGRRDWVDNQERFRGHVGKRKDAQRNLNARVAKLMLISSVSPIAKPVFAPEQIPPALMDEWSRANLENLPFLRALPLRSEDGQVVSQGPLFTVTPPDIPAVEAQLLQFSVQTLSADNDTADEVKANTSADAMDLAASRVDSKSGIYLDNMRQSMQREGEIYRDMARELYWRFGRKVETLDDDDKDSVEELGQTVLDEDGTYRIRNDLTSGRYKVIASVTESTTTKKQRTVKQCLAVAQVAASIGNTSMANRYLLTAGMNMDGEGLGDVRGADRHELISLGVVKPTREEAQEIQQAQEAQQNQQPDPATIALQSQAAKDQSAAQLNQAKVVETEASAALKTAQAQAVGGPEQAPDVPSGLSPAETQEKEASANLKNAQAEHLRETIGHQRIKLGRELNIGERQQRLAERQQDHAERTSGEQ